MSNGVYAGGLSSRWTTAWLADWWADVVLYRRLIGARLRAQMQYRTSFLLMTLVSLITAGSDLWAILILFNYFGELAGWHAGEVALLYGLATLTFGTAWSQLAPADALLEAYIVPKQLR